MLHCSSPDHKLKLWKLLQVAWLFIPALTYGRSVSVWVHDCASGAPVEAVQILNGDHVLLGTTDDAGKATINLYGKDEQVSFIKLGYETKTVDGGQLDKICLQQKVEEINEVTIGASRPHYFDTLTRLRKQNRVSFLDFDAILTYSFDYIATDLKTGSLIDKASGYFTVYYEDGYAYPNLFTNSNHYERVTDFQYQFNEALPEAYFIRIKYLSVSSLLCCYDMMEEKFNNPDWWNYKGMEAPEKTKIFSEQNGGRVFATYTSSDKLSKRFYFNDRAVLNKIEIFRPMVFYQANYDDRHCTFLVSVNYTKQSPRVVDEITYDYETDSSGVSFPYKIKLHIQLVEPKPQMIKVTQGNENNVVLSLIGSFHQIYRNLKEARLKGWIKK